MATALPAKVLPSDIIKAILIDKDENPMPGQPMMSVLFDEDSILYNQDQE